MPRFGLRALLVEWAVLALVLALASGALALTESLWRIDRSFYDALLPTFQRPAPDDVAIVAIDETSLVELGRWPWPREHHARLIDRLRQAGVRAVALDLVFTEPSGETADAALSESIAAAHPLVLPVFQERGADGALVEMKPLPVLAEAASALGHIDSEVDPDGIVRSAFLRAGLGAPRWSSLAVALLEEAGAAPAQLPGVRNPRTGGWSERSWVRDHRILVPFAGRPGHFPRYSASQVLQARHDAELRGKLVLVGATAGGLGDMVPTPVSGYSEGMPGVEFHANVLDAVRRGLAIVPLPSTWGLALTVGLVLIPVLLLPGLTPLRGLVLTAVWILAVAGASLALLEGTQLWWGPSAAIFGILAAYPLWSWRRLAYTVRYMDDELARIRTEPHLFAEGARAVQTHGALEMIQERVDNLRAAQERMRSLRRFISDSLEQMADGMLVADPAGQVLMANGRASELLSAFGSVEGVQLEELLAMLGREDGGTWPEALARVRVGGEAEECYARHGNGRDLLVALAPFRLSEQWTGVIATVADVTPLKESERRRAAALRFLSHDLRSPLLSILATAESEAARGGGGEALTRVTRYADSALALADDFLELARAESTPQLRIEDCDLVALAHEAADDAWALAQDKGIGVERRMGPDELWLRIDPRMIRRALGNLIGNAVKYSPPGTAVGISLTVAEGWARCCVHDEGIGISADELPHVFEPFRRVHRAGSDEPGGLGLGLAFVKLAAERHGGRVEVESRAGRGSTFCLLLPVAEGGAG